MIDMPLLQQWKGRRVTWSGRITEEPIARMAATLGRRDLLEYPPKTLPPLWHWLYGAPALDESALQVDGMPRGSDIVPPIPLPRRMWASSALQFHGDLEVDDLIRKESEVVDITHKKGRSGELVFVELLHRLFGPKELALSERHTIVFRDAAPTSGQARPENPEAGRVSMSDRPGDQKNGPNPASEADVSEEVTVNEIALFRYSALTFNSHRIHYDRPYATEVEGYPGLIVHGPLIATLLMDLVNRQFPNQRIGEFTFKAVRPIFDGRPFMLNLAADSDGKFRVWAANLKQEICMQAEGAFR